MTTIERLDVDRLSLPLHTPFVTALRRATTVETVVVRITDSDGCTGWGEAPQVWQVTGDNVAGSAACLEGPLADVLVGAPASPESASRIATAVVGNCAAKAAADVALHDLAARRAGLPLLATGRVPTVVTLPVGEPDAVEAASRGRVAEGFRALKLKVGTDAATDLARVRAAREGAGPDVALRIDANQGWDARAAVELIRAIEDAGLGVELVEQPVRARDLIGLAHVRAHVETPVLADESVFDLDDLVELIRHDAADSVNLKLAKCGGLTPVLELARVARLHGLGVTVGSMLESHVGVGAASALAAYIGCDVVPDLDAAWWLAASPYDGGVVYEAGEVVLPSGPGLGIQELHR